MGNAISLSNRRDSNACSDSSATYRSASHVKRRIKLLEELVSGPSHGRRQQLLSQLNARGADGSARSTSDILPSAPEDFKLGCLIAAGSYGRVYAGSYRGQPAALKLLILDEESAAAILNEVRLCLKLNHQNLVRLLDCAVVSTSGQYGASAPSSEADQGGWPYGASCQPLDPACPSSYLPMLADQPLACDSVPGIPTAGCILSSTSNPHVVARAVSTQELGVITANDLLFQEQRNLGLTSSSGHACFEVWIAMELCDCGTLADQVQRGFQYLPGSQQVDMELLLSLALDIARALSYMHCEQVCHGDLKSENVLLKSLPAPLDCSACDDSNWRSMFRYAGSTSSAKQRRYSSDTCWSCYRKSSCRAECELISASGGTAVSSSGSNAQLGASRQNIRRSGRSGLYQSLPGLCCFTPVTADSDDVDGGSAALQGTGPAGLTGGWSFTKQGKDTSNAAIQQVTDNTVAGGSSTTKDSVADMASSISSVSCMADADTRGSADQGGDEASSSSRLQLEIEGNPSPQQQQLLPQQQQQQHGLLKMQSSMQEYVMEQLKQCTPRQSLDRQQALRSGSLHPGQLDECIEHERVAPLSLYVAAREHRRVRRMSNTCLLPHVQAALAAAAAAARLQEPMFGACQLSSNGTGVSISGATNAASSSMAAQASTLATAAAAIAADSVRGQTLGPADDYAVYAARSMPWRRRHSYCAGSGPTHSALGISVAEAAAAIAAAAAAAKEQRIVQQQPQQHQKRNRRMSYDECLLQRRNPGAGQGAESMRMLHLHSSNGIAGPNNTGIMGLGRLPAALRRTPSSNQFAAGALIRPRSRALLEHVSQELGVRRASSNRRRHSWSTASASRLAAEAAWSKQGKYSLHSPHSSSSSPVRPQQPWGKQAEAAVNCLEAAIYGARARQQAAAAATASTVSGADGSRQRRHSWACFASGASAVGLAGNVGDVGDEQLLLQGCARSTGSSVYARNTQRRRRISGSVLEVVLNRPSPVTARLSRNNSSSSLQTPAASRQRRSSWCYDTSTFADMPDLSLYGIRDDSAAVLMRPNLTGGSNAFGQAVSGSAPVGAFSSRSLGKVARRASWHSLPSRQSSIGSLSRPAAAPLVLPAAATAAACGTTCMDAAKLQHQQQQQQHVGPAAKNLALTALQAVLQSNIAASAAARDAWFASADCVSSGLAAPAAVILDCSSNSSPAGMQRHAYVQQPVTGGFDLQHSNSANVGSPGDASELSGSAYFSVSDSAAYLANSEQHSGNTAAVARQQQQPPPGLQEAVSAGPSASQLVQQYKMLIPSLSDPAAAPMPSAKALLIGDSKLPFVQEVDAAAGLPPQSPVTQRCVIYHDDSARCLAGSSQHATKAVQGHEVEVEQQQQQHGQLQAIEQQQEQQGAAGLPATDPSLQAGDHELFQAHMQRLVDALAKKGYEGMQDITPSSGVIPHIQQQQQQHGQPLEVCSRAYSTTSAASVSEVLQSCQKSRGSKSAQHYATGSVVSGPGQRKFCAKVCDFGFSQCLHVGQSHCSTAAAGTITHQAPEVLKRGYLSPAADVYAFGIILWELLTGQRPFLGMLEGDLVVGVCEQGLRPTFPPGAPAAYVVLAQQCWAEDPAARPTAQQVLRRLNEMLYEEHRTGQCKPYSGCLGGSAGDGTNLDGSQYRRRRHSMPAFSAARERRRSRRLSLFLPFARQPPVVPEHEPLEQQGQLVGNEQSADPLAAAGAAFRFSGSQAGSAVASDDVGACPGSDSGSTARVQAGGASASPANGSSKQLRAQGSQAGTEWFESFN